MKKDTHTIGRVEFVSFPEVSIFDVPARIDTGAKTSSVWASDISFNKAGQLKFYLFDRTSRYYKKKLVVTDDYTEVIVASSMGTIEKRYKVRLLIKIDGRRIRGSFTLTNRATRVYPVLVGRNLLHGKFIVDVKLGTPDRRSEKARHEEFEELLKKGKQE